VIDRLLLLPETHPNMVTSVLWFKKIQECNGQIAELEASKTEVHKPLSDVTMTPPTSYLQSTVVNQPMTRCVCIGCRRVIFVYYIIQETLHWKPNCIPIRLSLKNTIITLHKSLVKKEDSSPRRLFSELTQFVSLLLSCGLF